LVIDQPSGLNKSKKLARPQIWGRAFNENLFFFFIDKRREL